MVIIYNIVIFSGSV